MCGHGEIMHSIKRGTEAGSVVAEKVNLRDKLARFDTHWDPKIVGELNGQQIKLVKLKGDFIWHAHESEDEMFLVVSGSLEMRFRDRSVTVNEGEFLIVPRGVEHCPVAQNEAHVLLFEPAGTVNTGDAGGARTVSDPNRI